MGLGSTFSNSLMEFSINCCEDTKPIGPNLTCQKSYRQNNQLTKSHFFYLSLQTNVVAVGPISKRL